MARPASFTQLGKPFRSNSAGDGPPRRAATRTAADLRVRQVSQHERIKRGRVLSEFLTQAGFPPPVEGRPAAGEIWKDPDLMASKLAAFGQQLYDSGRSRNDFVATINAVAETKGSFRTLLRVAWDVDRSWQLLEPVEHRLPMPYPLFCAALVLCFLSGRIEFAALLLLGFSAALRPGEMLNLRRRDLILPSDLLGAAQEMFVIISNPKSKRCRSSEHVILDDPLIVAFFEWYCKALTPDSLLWPWSPYYFQRDWDWVFSGGLKVSTHGENGFTFGTLRAGCATEIYRKTRQIDLVRWHLRHRSAQTSLENYVQELPQALARARLSVATRETVLRFAHLSDQALSDAVLGTFGPGFRLALPIRIPRPRRRPKVTQSAHAPVRRSLVACLSSDLLDGGYWAMRVPEED